MVRHSDYIIRTYYSTSRFPKDILVPPSMIFNHNVSPFIDALNVLEIPFMQCETYLGHSFNILRYTIVISVVFTDQSSKVYSTIWCDLVKTD